MTFARSPHLCSPQEVDYLRWQGDTVCLPQLDLMSSVITAFLLCGEPSALQQKSSRSNSERWWHRQGRGHSGCWAWDVRVKPPWTLQPSPAPSTTPHMCVSFPALWLTPVINQLTKRTGLLWLRALEVSVHDWLAPLLLGLWWGSTS
jgi:hypothetical protein